MKAPSSVSSFTLTPAYVAKNMGITKQAMRQAYTRSKYLFLMPVVIIPMMARKNVMPPKLVIVRGKILSHGERKLNLVMW